MRSKKGALGETKHIKAGADHFMMFYASVHQAENEQHTFFSNDQTNVARFRRIMIAPAADVGGNRPCRTVTQLAHGSSPP